MSKMPLFATAALALVFASASQASAQTNVMLIFDASGSMKREVGGESRISAAKRAVGAALSSMPASARLGLMAYGHRRPRDCTDIELVAPIASEKAPALARYVEALDARGETPIAETLRRAGKSFAAFKGQRNAIVLITDGIEECGGDPCAAAESLTEMGVDLKVNVVGFTLGRAAERAARGAGGRRAGPRAPATAGSPRPGAEAAGRAEGALCRRLRRRRAARALERRQ
jgi:Ca-activated chloride channel homolog